MQRLAVLALVAVVSKPYAAWPQGNPVGPEFRVNTRTTGDQDLPSVAADSSGNFVVVWMSYYKPGPGSSLDIFGQRYAGSGTPLGPEFRVNMSPQGVHFDPAVAAAPAGDLVVVIWAYGPLEAAGLRGRRFAGSGAPLGGEFVVGNSNYNYAPAVTSDASGNFVVVWHGFFPSDGSGKAVFGRRFASSGAPQGPAFVVNTYTTGDQVASSVASDPAGNFIVTWRSVGQDGSSDGVFAQRFANSGVPLGPEFRVNTYTTSNQGRPTVAADSGGNFVVVWQSSGQDGSADGVFGQRYASSGAPLGPEFRVNTVTTGNQGYPSVTGDAAGNFVVVWQSSGQDGSGNAVFGQRFEATGSPLGPEFAINTYSTSNQDHPAVAADPLGDFVVVWQSFGQDGADLGIFGQRYNMIVPVELMDLHLE